MKTNFSRAIGWVLLLFSQSYASVCSDLKLDREIVFGYFNGVQTTPKEARKALSLIQTKFLSSYVSLKNEQIEYVLFYNKTEGFSDFAETFGQREAEHLKIVKDKYEYFWYLHSHNTDFLNKARRSKKLKEAFEELSQAENEAARALAISSLLSLLDTFGIIDDSNTTLLMEENHKEKLDCIANANKKTLLFAHSQGNLFVVEAYRHMLQLVPKKSGVGYPCCPGYSGRCGHGSSFFGR